MIEGFVLAGGASSRMGKPKAGLILGGTTMLDRAVAAISPVSAGNVTAILPEDLRIEGVDTNSLRVAHDFEIPGTKQPTRAPIVGLYSALKLSSAPWIAVLAVDLPFVTAELFMRLAYQISDGIDVVVPVQEDGNLQPLCALYRVETVLPVIDDALRSRDVSLRGVISKVEARRVAFDEIADLPGSQNFFRNLNTPADYEAALSIADAA